LRRDGITRNGLSPNRTKRAIKPTLSLLKKQQRIIIKSIWGEGRALFVVVQKKEEDNRCAQKRLICERNELAAGT